MDVTIGEVASTVHTVDGDALLDPRTMQRIVAAVLQAVREQEAHDARVRAERRVSAGVRQEQEENGR
jgi:hypothetical protein